ncbi:MAG: LysR family transcriptional regulator [Tissierellia bacterium]|nr:LysR family transcriptional regulator [Tissierellia bacterium]
MNLKNLEYFIKVVRAKSFTRASEDLYLSQSTLSKAVKNLEQELDTQLLKRERNQIFLTEDGKYILEKGEELLLLIENRVNEMYHELYSKRDRLMVGIPSLITEAYFETLIHDFQQQYPKIQFHFVEAGGNTLHKMLRENSLDIAILKYPISDDLLRIEILEESQNAIVVNRENPLAKKDQVCLNELKDEKFILLDDKYQIHNEIITRCRQEGFEPSILAQSYQWDFICQMISKRGGISILPYPIVRRIHFDNLKILEFQDNPLPWGICLAMRKDAKLTEGMEKFMEYAKKTVLRYKEEPE